MERQEALVSQQVKPWAARIPVVGCWRTLSGKYKPKKMWLPHPWLYCGLKGYASPQFGICCAAVEKKQIPRPINLARGMTSFEVFVQTAALPTDGESGNRPIL
jgi:hypothetical protein